MILADTSIWLAMFRTGDYKAELETLIVNDQLCIHPFLIAELALGTLPERRRTLAYLDQLISVRPVWLEDVRHMIEARGLASKEIGLTDAHLIAFCLATPGTQIWTLDGKLGKVAESLICSDPSISAHRWGCFCCCFCLCSRTGPAAAGAGFSDD